MTKVTRVKLRLLPREHMSHQMAQRKKQRQMRRQVRASKRKMKAGRKSRASPWLMV